jgi:hypothetical protein
MIRFCLLSALTAALFVCAGAAQAEEKEKEPTAVFELGGAAEWSLRNGSSSFGPAVAVEVTPIENWLEIEAGVAPLVGNGQTEWNADLLFKKPFTLSKTVEFMVGLGPEWLHTTGGGKSTDSFGGEVALDFMFWPTADRKLGWFLEPSYGYDFGSGHEQSVGVSAGLLIAIP